jgi:hypothetical protein
MWWYGSQAAVVFSIDSLAIRQSELLGFSGFDYDQLVRAFSKLSRTIYTRRPFFVRPTILIEAFLPNRVCNGHF